MTVAEERRKRRRVLIGAQGKKGKLDRLWGRAVMLAAGGICQLCGKPNSSDPHHLIHKSAGHRFRWVFDNGLLLCAGCHRFNTTVAAHGGGLRFADLVREKLPGVSAWYEIAFLHNKQLGSKTHTLEELEEIREELESIIAEYE